MSRIELIHYVNDMYSVGDILLCNKVQKRTCSCLGCRWTEVLCVLVFFLSDFYKQKTALGDILYMIGDSLHMKLKWHVKSTKKSFFKHLIASNLAALWPRDLELLEWKDLNSFPTCIKSSRDWELFKDRFCPLKMTSFT